MPVPLSGESQSKKKNGKGKSGAPICRLEYPFAHFSGPLPGFHINKIMARIKSHFLGDTVQEVNVATAVVPVDSRLSDVLMIARARAEDLNALADGSRCIVEIETLGGSRTILHQASSSLPAAAATATATALTLRSCGVRPGSVVRLLVAWMGEGAEAEASSGAGTMTGLLLGGMQQQHTSAPLSTQGQDQDHSGAPR